MAESSGGKAAAGDATVTIDGEPAADDKKALERHVANMERKVEKAERELASAKELLSQAKAQLKGAK